MVDQADVDAGRVQIVAPDGFRAVRVAEGLDLASHGERAWEMD